MLIGELAKRADVSKDTIRHYNDLNLLIVQKRQAGTRTYWDFPAENISRVKLIQAGKSFGITLSEMKPLIKAYDNDQMTEQEIIKLLEDRLQIVRSKMKSLAQMEELILTKLSLYK